MIQYIKYDLISMIYETYERHMRSWKEKKNQLIGGNTLLKGQ